jgi:RHS repeat-associated protein
MEGGRAASTIVGAVVKDLLGDAAEDVGKDALRDGLKATAKDTAKDAAEATGKDAGKDAAKAGEEGAERDAGKALKDGKPGEDPGTRTKTPDPIDVATGEVLFAETDLTLPGVLPLVFERIHVSSYRQGGLYGISWASTLDQRLEITADAIRYAAPDGTIRTYPPVFSPGIELPPTTGPVRPLTWLGADGYVIDDPRTGHRLHFPAAGGMHGWRLPIAAISDRNGNRITFHYDQTDTLTEVRHSGGYRIAVDTDGPDGRKRVRALRLLTSDEGEGIVVIRYGYDPAGHLTEVINSSGLPLKFSYDDVGRMTGWRDRNGHEYHYDYDEHGRAVRGHGTDGYLDVSLTFEPSATVLTDSLGHQTTYHLNERRQVIAETNPFGHITTSEWDERDRLVARTDPLGHTTRYTYDQFGNCTRVERPDGAVTRVIFDGPSNPTRLTAADGTEWRYVYDQAGNVTATTDPMGATTYFGYDDRGGLATVTDAVGSTFRIATNPAGLPVNIMDPLGATAGYGRDVFGRVTTVTDPVGGTTRLGWSIENRPTIRVLPSGAVETWEYDAEGNLVTYIDGIGQVTRTTYGPFDAVVSESKPDGARLEFSHDTELRLTHVTNPQGLTWEYVYNAVGDLVQESDFNNRTLRYVHDAAGQLVRRINGTGEITDYSRDVLGNLTEQRTGRRVTSFAYDTAGRLTRAINPDAQLVFEHDLLGRIVAETCNGRTVSSTYDPVGRRIRRRTPSGAESVWTYDRAGRPASLGTGGQQLRFTHDEAGRETRRHIGTGAILDQRYDTDHQLISQALWGAPEPHAPGGDRAGLPGQARPQLLQHRTYARRQDGRITAIGDRVNGDRTIDLDRAGRVIAVNANGWNERYAYDPAGNITHAMPADRPEQEDLGSAVAGEYAYSGTLIRRAGRTLYDHDAQGRLTRRRDRTLSGQVREWAYTWDVDDRLVAVVTPDGQHWRYQYDGLGRRIGKQRLGADQRTVVEQVAFTWDESVLVEQVQSERDGSSPAVRTTTWDYEPDTFSPLAQTESVTLVNASQQWVDQRFYAIITDLIGTPMEMVDPAGNLTRHSQASLWGYEKSDGVDRSYCPLRFPGQYYDRESGFHYNFFRYYDPTSGRYAAADPLGLGGGWNPHKYVDNPQTWLDPLGLKGDDLKYVTYTKTNKKTGKVYTGRSRGVGTPVQIVAARDVGHHMTDKGFGAAVLDKSVTAAKSVAERHSDPAYQAIRGREQQLIDHFGGAQSFGGTSGNAIRGIATDNPLLDTYMKAAKKMFG